jgi:hypothetical protein
MVSKWLVLLTGAPRTSFGHIGWAAVSIALRLRHKLPLRQQHGLILEKDLVGAIEGWSTVSHTGKLAARKLGIRALRCQGPCAVGA